MKAENPAWDAIISSLPEAHVLQTIEWALVKSRFGWSAYPKVWVRNNQIAAAALILSRDIKLPITRNEFRILYVPKGPLIKDWTDHAFVQEVFEDLKTIGKTHNAILIKIDTDVEIGKGERNDELWRLGFNRKNGGFFKNVDINEPGFKLIKHLSESGWVFSREQVQFRNTILSDLSEDDATLLGKMKQKTRYNIRLAEKKGVVIRQGTKADFPNLYDLYAETARRDGFIIRDYRYYETVWSIFSDVSGSANMLQYQDNLPDFWRIDPKNHPQALILIAEYGNQPIAGIILFIFQNKAWFIYGMSSSQDRDKMPNYLLHWKAIQMLKELGVNKYDWWGAPEIFSESDPMYGVYKFKMGFGGEVIRRIGAWDFPLKRNQYVLYQIILPKILRYLSRKERIGIS